MKIAVKPNTIVRAGFGATGLALLLSLAGAGCESKFETPSSRPRLWFQSSLRGDHATTPPAPVTPPAPAGGSDTVALAPTPPAPSPDTAPAPPVVPTPGPTAPAATAPVVVPATVANVPTPAPAAPPAEGVAPAATSPVPTADLPARPIGEGAAPVPDYVRQSASTALVRDEGVDLSPRHPEETLAKYSTRVARFWHKVPPRPVGDVQPDPQPDEAARRRNFPRSVSYYENADVVAGPNYRIDAPQIKGRGVPQAVTDYSPVLTATPTFLFEAVIAPFRAFFEPPLTTRLQHDGANFPPSFTVAPPLPPE